MRRLVRTFPNDEMISTGAEATHHLTHTISYTNYSELANDNLPNCLEGYQHHSNGVGHFTLAANDQ